MRQIRPPDSHTMEPNPVNRHEANRLLEIASKLLAASDLVGSKCFAERALESDPLLAGVDQILAIADVLLASQIRVNNQPDYYSILQLPPPTSSESTGISIKRSYRHLALLLSPAQNNLLYADAALRKVSEAHSFLSDPAKKSLYDSHLHSTNIPPASPPQPPTVRLFWTSCPSCCHVFEYDRVYVGRTLRCRVCMRAFHAGEMAKAPHVVPGTDTYYCAWGFFPLGFPGSGFGNFDAASAIKEAPLDAVPVNVVKGGKRSLPVRNKKAVAKKRVGSCVKRRDLFGETDSEVEAAEMGGGRVGAAGTEEGGEGGISNFEIDLEATGDLLSNLHDLPFV